MELPSTFEFQGWSIRFAVKKPAAVHAPQGKCVVFVHGTPWSSVVYQPIIEALLARGSYHILVYDLPGYGQSQSYSPDSHQATSAAGFPGDTSVKFQAGALTALLQHVQWDGMNGCPAPAVVAHDIAGAIVLRAHTILGCQFDTMLFMDTNAVLPWGDGFYKLVRSEPATFMKLPASIFEAMVRAVVRSACHDPRVLQNGWEDALTQPWIDSASDGASAGERQRSFVRQIAHADDSDVADMLLRNKYGSVQCEVKIVWGEEDSWIPREKIEQLIEKLQGSVKEQAFIPRAGHLVMLDQPARVAIEVVDWLTRYGTAKSLSKA
ncbi:hypothetical protein B0A50_04401 [Salinomyces thailandicus]|uniref:AB hydrolase-1 domain-containing protein n=1 Tax=Salinomyces thailandicus TaxID=706561 RepID=A0A4U0TYH4_9PEZI|nr:hypothetical protein B0A50_04401 [Salinomyces thailandica]